MSQTNLNIPESALHKGRFEFVPEPSPGVVPDDPAFRPISDGILEFNPGYGHELSEDFYIGTPDARREVISESHEPEITYPMQTWFLDTNGKLQNLVTYGMLREANLMPETVTLIHRVDAGTQNPQYSQYPKVIDPSSTINANYNPAADRKGSDSTGKTVRVYDVLKGMKVGEGVLTAENTDESTINCEVSGMSRYGRPYVVDQPTSDNTLYVFATPTTDDGTAQPGSVPDGINTDDTGITVVIESEDPAGAGSAETVTLNADDASTPVETTETFADIDAIEIRGPNGEQIDGELADYFGDVVVAESVSDGASGTEPGEWLFVGLGSDSYDGNVHGDQGIPALGAGSRAGRISAAGARPAFYSPGAVTIERPVGTLMSVVGVLNTMELSTENDIGSVSGGDRTMIPLDGTRSLEFTVSLTGEEGTTPRLQSAGLSGEYETTRVNFNSRKTEFVDLTDAPLDETDAGVEGGETQSDRESTFLPQVGADNGPAITISNAAD